MPLNHITEKIDLKYDKGGQLAQKGQLLPKLLNELNALPYYEQPYPKSTGYEWFSAEVKPLIDTTKATSEDLLCTLIHHNCEQISLAVLMEKPQKGSRLLVTGGGALNDYFVQTLQEKLGSKCKVIVPPKKFIEYKEAMVFAFMGVLQSIGETNVLASVTGAKRDSCSGEGFIPKI